MKSLSTCILIAFIGAALTACNGGGDSAFAGGGGSGNGSGGATAPGAGGTTTVALGSGSGGNFQAGTLAIATARLSAGGTTTVSATLVKSDGTPFTDAVGVSFISDCVQQGLATLESPVKADNGAAVSTYTDKGCGTTDTITASATIGGTRLTAQGTVVVAPAELGAIAFISADPATISFNGSGLTEASRVTFEVRDSTGNPLRNQTVNFSLSTKVGGITLSQDSAVSGADGKVATVVQAGTIPTPVRVKATVADTNVSTQSSVLTISTGIADADSFSIAVETLNPEAYNYDGVTDKVTVHLADRFNNPVPDGTAVSFMTEGGSIEPRCQTTKGECTVTWQSQNPRPANGRVTILAYVIGEESFTDTDGNGVFNAGDTFTDLGEPYEDKNEDGAYTPGEPFYDFHQGTPAGNGIDGVRDGPDGQYEGLQCTDNCGAVNTTGIGAQIALVMSGSTAIICTTPTTFASPACTTPLSVGPGGTLTLYVADVRGQTMPSGTTIKISGKNVDINPASITVPSTAVPPALAPYTIQVTKQDTTKVASLTVTVTTPKGLSTPPAAVAVP